MLPRILEARYRTGYIVWVRFSDGTEGDVDFSGELDGPIFEPLRDVEFFAQVSLHPELRTLVWPNGADFAPEFIWEHLHVAA